MKRFLLQTLLATIALAIVGGAAFAGWEFATVWRRYPVTVQISTVGCTDPEQWMKAGRNMVTGDGCFDLPKGTEGVMHIRFKNRRSTTADQMVCVKFPIAEKCLIMEKVDLYDH